MELVSGTPLKGRILDNTIQFLNKMDLDYDQNVEYTVNFMEDGEILATGSRQGNVLKCIAVSPQHQGEGLSGRLMTELIANAVENGLIHLFLFTKPQNETIFLNSGFYSIARTKDVLMMENTKNGIQNFIKNIRGPEMNGTIGCIVANCNPFTNGHLYLVEKAANRCDLLYLFILSEEKSMFPSNIRLQLAQRATKQLKNVLVCPTGDYLISSATFPDYFIKDKTNVDNIHCDLDLAVFTQQIAPPLGITCRFVGTEPLSPVTEHYNEAMLRELPAHGIQVNVIPRAERGGAPISASRVRTLILERKLGATRSLVPDSTFQYLMEQYGKKESFIEGTNTYG